MKNIIKVLLTCFITLTAVNANAALVKSSSLTVGGLLDIGEGITLDNASYITLAGVTGTSATGDIDDVWGITGSGGTVNLPPPNTVSVPNFMNIDGWNFDLSTINTLGVPTADLLKLEGTGLLHDADNNSYNATWSFTAQSPTNYSMTVTTVVPVPAAAWLFGSGLIGLVGLARKKA